MRDADNLATPDDDTISMAGEGQKVLCFIFRQIHPNVCIPIHFPPEGTSQTTHHRITPFIKGCISHANHVSIVK
ncbi:hypothetical protein EU245_13645 [Lentibacillus lipolyticus]|nr:hypothetical protein EU245_13645 [Lentibacillus lipolyticus]